MRQLRGSMPLRTIGSVILAALTCGLPIHADEPVQIDTAFPVLGVALAPDGKTVACVGAEYGRRGPKVTGSQQPAVQVFDLATHKLIFEERPSARGGVVGRRRAFYTTSTHQHLDYSPNGKLLAWTGSNMDFAAYLREAVHGDVKALGPTDDPRTQLSGVCFTPDSKAVLTAAATGSVSVWDVATGKKQRDLEPGLGEIGSMVLAPSGTTLACADRGDQVVLLDAGTGAVQRKLTHPGGEFLFLAFAPEGDVLLTACSGPAHLWQVATGRLLGKLDDNVVAAAFSADGRTLALATASGALRLWDPASLKLLGERGGEHHVQAVAFSVDGRRLAAAGVEQGKGAIRLWDVAAITRRPCTLRALAPPELDRHWTDLGGDNAYAAQRAIAALAAGARQSVPYLRARLKPAAALDHARLGRLLADLDSDQFAAREKATAGLTQLGWPVLPVLRKAMSTLPSHEARRRLEKIIERIEEQVLPTAELQARRAVEVLTQIKAPEAQEVLETLCRGEPVAAVTGAAAAALKRRTR